MQSKMNIPLFLAIVLTIGFNLAPIAVGPGMALTALFVPYAGLLFILSLSDRRVLGYGAVLTACNPANDITKLSFSLLLAVVAIGKEFSGIGEVVRELGARGWWKLYVGALLLVGLSVPCWYPSLPVMITEAKHVLSHLGYLVALPLAVGLTIRTPRDGVRAISLLCLMAVAQHALFFFFGSEGAAVDTSDTTITSIGVRDVMRQIGHALLNFNRTQTCIPLAAMAAGTVSLAVSAGLRLRAAPFYLACGACVVMIMHLASTGSAFAMVCGMSVLAIGYQVGRVSLGRILLGGVLFSLIGLTLFGAIFYTDNYLATRIALKVQAGNIDRWELWMEGVSYIVRNPIGGGWPFLSKGRISGHDDFFVYMIAYGWPTGLLYIAAAGRLFLSMAQSLIRKRFESPQVRVLLLVGMAGLTVYVVNSILDMLSGNIGFYQTVWAMILTSATVVAVTREVAVDGGNAAYSSYDGTMGMDLGSNDFRRMP